MIGRTLSHYQITAKLGEGGMGEVWRATDTALDRDVALKVLPDEMAADPERLERFRREARAIAALNHPNIVTIYSVEEAEGVHLLTMELVDGKSLDQMLPPTGFDLERLFPLAIQIADALAAAHEKGIVHRDLKPANVMVSGDGRVKVLDFGLAKLAEAEEEDAETQLMTRDGMMLGTVPYMSPEQVQAKPVDHRSDVFSLGILLYEMATGRRPFRGDNEASVISAVLRDQPPLLTEVKAELPNHLGRIVRRCLEKNPDLRYQSAKSLHHELETLHEELKIAQGTVRQPLPSEQSAPAATEQSGDAAPPRPDSVTFTIGRKKLWPVAAVVAVGAVALGWWLLAGRGGSGGPGQELEASIAVLPFENLSGDAAREYISDGLTDSIIGHLSTITDLKVISRTSSGLYKKSNKSLPVIGEELGVATLLEGSVQLEGNNIRIMAQLIDAQEEGHIWSATFDREMESIFAIQSEIAQQIAAALQIELSPHEEARIEAVPTSDLTAYDNFLKGLEHYERFRRHDNETAIELFQRAHQIDPDFALPLAFLADAYVTRVNLFGFPRLWVDEGMAAARKALAIDPGLAQAHASLSYAYRSKGRIRDAEEAARQAVQLNPNDIHALINLGWALNPLGKIDEAMALFRKRVELDPGNAVAYWSIGWQYLALGEFDEAERWATRALEIQPDDSYGLHMLADLYWAAQRGDAAAEISERLLSLSPDDPSNLVRAGLIAIENGETAEGQAFLERALHLSPEGLFFGGHAISTYLASALWNSGDRSRAESLLQRSEAIDEARIASGDTSHLPTLDLALVHAIRGEREEALRWLRRSIDAGFVAYAYIEETELWSSIQEDPGFQRAVAEMKAKVDVMRRRVEEMEREWEAE